VVISSLDTFLLPLCPASRVPVLFLSSLVYLLFSVRGLPFLSSLRPLASCLGSGTVRFMGSVASLRF